MKRSLPWLSSLLAGVFVLTPTYGIGLAISPLTLIGSAIALSPLARATRAVRIGAAVNLLVLVAGLSLLTATWVTTAGPPGLFLLAIAWVLLIVIFVISYVALSQPGRQRSRPSGNSARAA
jgi:hypothetical protein